MAAAPTPSRPVFTGGLAVNAQVGHRLTYHVVVDGPAEFTAVGLPPEFVIHPRTGVISGLPIKPRQAHVTVCARNAAGVTKADLNLTVTK